MKRKNHLFYFILTLILIFLLKLFYENAAVDTLISILKPISKVAGFFTGIEFVSQTGMGFLSIDKTIVIDKSCAGINFLTVLIALSAFTLINADYTWKENLKMWLLSLFYHCYLSF